MRSTVCAYEADFGHSGGEKKRLLAARMPALY
jgi:hypothetical protein